MTLDSKSQYPDREKGILADGRSSFYPIISIGRCVSDNAIDCLGKIVDVVGI